MQARRDNLVLAMTSLCVWPSIVVKRGSTVVLGRTIVKGECKKNFRRTLFKVNSVQMTTITKSKSVSFSFLSRPTDPVLLLIFYLQQEIKLEWPKQQRLKCVALPTSILLGVANGCAKYDWSVYQNLSIFEL